MSFSFYTENFLQEAKKQFIQIQKIWDNRDINQLRNYLTDELIFEFERKSLKDGPSFQGIEVIALNAELVDFCEKILII
ncbi:MAG: TIM44-like domain-containing protein [Bordetella sp.]|nr:MAG: TIM44-like domain-containing protein [Bordetella sp.]